MVTDGTRVQVVILGDTAVGKSCMITRFVRDEFFAYQEPTIGAAFLSRVVHLRQQYGVVPDRRGTKKGPAAVKCDIVRRRCRRTSTTG